MVNLRIAGYLLFSFAARFSSIVANNCHFLKTSPSCKLVPNPDKIILKLVDIIIKYRF